MKNHGRFMTMLAVARWPQSREWALLFDLLYTDPSGHTHRVPSTFRSDFASVPRPIRALCFSLPKTHSAAVLHDYHYRVVKSNRRWADDLFYHALRASGVNPVSARIYWAAVRLFGWTAYRPH